MVDQGRRSLVKMLSVGAPIQLMLARPRFNGGLVPVISVNPGVTGTAAEGQFLTADNGVWLNGPTSYAYQWQTSVNGTTGWTNISGATAGTLLLTPALLGKYVRCGVRASNVVGPAIAFAYSSAKGPVTSDVVTPLLWPGDLWDGTANSGWLRAGVPVPVPTAYDMVTPRPSCRITTASFQRYNENLVLVTDANAPGGISHLEFDYENRVVTVDVEGGYDRSHTTGGTAFEYGHIVELDVAKALELLPITQTFGEARLFIRVYAKNPAIQPAVVGVDIQNTTDLLKGMAFYPCRGALVDRYVNIAKTPGYVSPINPAWVAETSGVDAWALAAAMCKAAPAGQRWGIRIIEQLPTVNGKMEGWRIGPVGGTDWTFQKWTMPTIAADNVIAIMGDDSQIYSQPGVDMLEFRGSATATDPRNVKLDWVRIGYQCSNCLMIPGRSAVIFDGVELYWGTPLVVDGVNPYDPTGPVGSGSGQAVLYGGRQAGSYLYSPANPAYTTYRCWIDTRVHDMAATGIQYAKVILNVDVDGVSGSCLENCVGSAHNVRIRDTGGASTGFRTQRSALRINNISAPGGFRWIEKTSINSAGSAPGSITLNSGTGYEPQIGTRTYNNVTMTPDGTMQGKGAYGGFGAKAQVVVTNGRIVSVNFSTPNGDAGVKYRIGEKLKPAAMPTSGPVKGSFYYVDDFGVNRSAYGTSTPSQFEFTLAGNFNLYQWPTNDPVAAKAAGPVKALLLQERAFTIKGVADAINDPVTGWGPEYTAFCDPAWSDVTRYDSTMLSMSALTQASAIPMTAFTTDVTLTGIIDIHSDNNVWTQNAFNVAQRFITADDFTITAWFSSGRGGRWNGVSVRNFVSRSVDAGNPQSGYFQCQIISACVQYITGFNAGGVGNNTFLGGGYTAAANSQVVYDRWMVDDMFWATTRSPNPLFTNYVMRVANTARVIALAGSLGNSKGLGNAFTPAQVFEDPSNPDVIVALRPKAGGPGFCGDGTPSGALTPVADITPDNRGWMGVAA